MFIGTSVGVGPVRVGVGGRVGGRRSNAPAKIKFYSFVFAVITASFFVAPVAPIILTVLLVTSVVAVKLLGRWADRVANRGVSLDK